MDITELILERDKLREKGVDIVVTPTRCGHHGFKRNYTFEIYFRTPDGKHDNDGPSRPLGLWHSYNEALEAGIVHAKDIMDRLEKKKI